MPILTSELIGRLFLVGIMLLAGAFGLFKWELMDGATVAEARTVAVNTFVMVQLFYLFNCRSLQKSMFQIGLFSNPWIWGGIAIMLLLQMLFTYLPAMNWMFQSAPIGIPAWGRILAVAVIAFFVVGFEKWLRRRHAQRHAPHGYPDFRRGGIS